MLPARNRVTVLYVYSSKANALANSGGTQYSTGIVEGTARLERTFYRALPAFGECNASMFECEISINVDLTGKWIRVATQSYASESSTSMQTYWLFLGKVDECKYDARQATRKLVAYDEMLDLRKTDISDWWTTYFTNASGDKTITQILTDMCSQYSVSKASGTLSNNITVYKSAQTARKLGGCSVAQMLSYIGQMSYCYFYFSKTGVLSWATPNTSATATSLTNAVDTVNSTFGDNVGSQIASVMVYENADVIYSSGSSAPTYTIRDNPLTLGRTTAQIATAYASHLSKAQTASGVRSAEIELIVSTFDLNTRVTYDSKSYLVSGYVASGTQLIDMVVTCTDELSDESIYNTSQIQQANDLTALGTEMTFKVNANQVIEAVNLEAQGGVQINAEALNINGVQSTGGKLKVGVNGDVEVDGKITSQEGTIGGWVIGQTTLESSNGAVTLDSAGIISATETGTTPQGAKFIAESSTDKAYYSAWGVRVENPPNMGTGNGTKALLQETGLVSETMASGGVFHGVALTDTSGNPALTLIDRSSSEEWRNQQTEQDIKITHTDKSVSPSVVDKTMQLDKNGLYQLNKDGTKDYMAHISPHASSSSGYVSRTGVSASDSSTLSSSYILDTVHTENFATIEAHAQKTEGNNVTWSSDSTIETTNMLSRLKLQGYQGSSATLGAYNNFGNAGGSGYETSSLSLETGSTAATNRNDWATATLSVTRANNSGSSKLSLRNRLSGTTHASEITPQTLKIDSHDLLRMSPHFAQMFATEIPANADLNTTTYVKCGQYYCVTSPTTFLNCPTNYQFQMNVSAMIYSTYDDETASSDKYRIRTITDYFGNQFIQRCIKPTNGSWSYQEWKRVVSSSDAVYTDQLDTRNKANNATIRQGSLSGTGTETSGTTRIRTGYIGIEPNSNYYIATHSSLQIYEIHEYTASAFVKYTAINATSTQIKTSGTTTRIRVLMRYSDNRTVTPDEGALLQVCKSTTDVEYSPFQPHYEALIPLITFEDVGVSSGDSTFFPAWLKRIGRNYDYYAGRFIKAIVQPNSQGVVYGYMYGGVTSDYMPMYSGFTYIGVGTMKYFGTNVGTFYIRSLSYT